MQLGMVGLGKMGANMTARLLQDGHDVVVFDVNPEAVGRSVDEGALGSSSLQDLVEQMDAPRAVWVMVPAGPITQQTVDALGEVLEAGDTIIDGGNSRYTDTLTRAETMAEKRITFVDAGTSGGVWGLKEGYCLMVGGERSAVERLEPIFNSLAPKNGFAHVGPPGAGHFVKMVHNGIEYSMMQAYGEGFEVLEKNGQFELDLAQIAEVWRYGSVIRSWLLDLAASALHKNPRLEGISDYVDDSGEGRWTLGVAIDQAVPMPALALALFTRFASRQQELFAGKLISALRNEFGGHAVHTE
ncbi:MAG: decarboxylating 6-phosphogluconate dehydrogenase [Actinomycetota bacterium]|nr:decarboxylating 6-phosphogluconate dehydrogenase [Actinomycetota bacterium]